MNDGGGEGFGDRIQRKTFLFHATASCAALLLLAGLALLGMHRISRTTFVLWLVLEVPVSYAFAWIVWLLINSASNGLVSALTAARGEPPRYGFSEQQALVAQGRPADAVASYRRYIDDHPGEVEGRIRLGSLLMEMRDLAGAEEAFCEARLLGGSAQQHAVIDNSLIDIHTTSGNRDALRGELARFSRTYAGTKRGTAARARLRAMVRPDEEG